MFPLYNGVASDRIFARSVAEFQSGDFTVAIVLSAIAVEAEFWRVFTKHNGPGQPGIMKGLDWLSGTTLDSFLAAHPDLTEKIWCRHPILRGEPSLRGAFHSRLFARRNQIVHRGHLDFGGAEAYECQELASTLFLIIGEMEAARIPNPGRVRIEMPPDAPPV